MLFDIETMATRDSYKLLTNLVVPRPIALVTSVGNSGVVNAAPFSFFNLVGSDPPICVLGLGNHPGGRMKDTDKNIRESGEYVVNIVSEAIAEQMNICAIDFGGEVSELAVSGLTAVAASKVKTPRIVESPASLEVVHVQTLEIGKNRIIMGRVVALHVRDGLVDPANLHVDSKALHAVGRMGSPNWYCRSDDQFEMARDTVATWEARSKS